MALVPDDDPECSKGVKNSVWVFLFVNNQKMGLEYHLEIKLLLFPLQGPLFWVRGSESLSK